ncbi:hypothetical protein FRC00_008261, partial [Tulasnella sp. 408]
MADHAKQQQPATTKNPSTSREEARFNAIRDALPPHLRPGDVPNPLKNLSTTENEHFTCLYKLAEQVRPPSDAVSNALFIDTMTKIMGENKAEYFSHSLVRLSKDRKYGYIAGVQPFEQSSTLKPLPFALFTLSSAADGRCLYGRYMWYDIPLPRLTEDDHLYRRMPTTIISSHSDGKIPCAAIVFCSFEDDLRNMVQAASSVPESQKEVMGQVCSKVAEAVTYQYGCRQDEIDSILKQVGASRQGSDKISATAERAERAEREVPNNHRPTSPTSTGREQPTLPGGDVGTHDKTNTPPRPISRKGKEKARYPEEECDEASDVTDESDAEAAVQIQYDQSYASQLANAEARRHGFTQDLLESIARDGVSRAMTQAEPEDDTSPLPGGSGIYPGIRIDGDPGAGSNSNSDQVQGRNSSAVTLPSSIPLRSDYRFATASLGGSATGPNQDTDRGDWSTRASDASSARSEQRPNISNGGQVDEGTSVRDEERRNGDDVLGNHGPVTPARGPGEKRKRTTPPSGDPDRPASKQQRPGPEIDKSSSPLSQRLDQGSRNETASLPQPNPELEGQSTSGQMRLSRLPARLPRTEYFTPIEEEGSGHEGVGLPGISKSQSSDVAAEEKEKGKGFEPSSGQNSTTSRTVKAFVHPRLQARQGRSTHESRGTSPTPTPGPSAPGITPGNPLRDLLPVTFDDPQSRSQAEGVPSRTKSTASVQTDHIHTRERSQQTSSGNSGSGSGPVVVSSAASYPRQQGQSTAESQPKGNTRVDGNSGTGGYSTGSSGSGSASVHPPEILSLLRGWRQSFIHVGSQTLAEAGIQITSPRTSSQQPVGIDQIIDEALRQRLSGSENHYTLLLSILETSYGVLSTVDPELLATAGLRLITRQPRLMSHQTRLSTSRPEVASNEATAPAGTAVPTAHSNVSSQSAMAPTQLAGVPPNEVADLRADSSATGSKIANTKTKQKDSRAKAKGNKSTDASDHGTANVITSHRRVTTDGQGDSKMEELEAQAPSHVSDSGVGGPPPMPQAGRSMESERMRRFSPMDTEWDDKAPDPEVSRSKETTEEKNTDRTNEPRDPPPGSPDPKREDHSQGSRTAPETQSASTRSQGEDKATKKKATGKRGAKENKKTNSPGEALPATEVQETFGEGPIIPDDEGPP